MTHLRRTAVRRCTDLARPCTQRRAGAMTNFRRAALAQRCEPPPAQPIEFRRATLAEVETVLDWAAQEGWNPGLDDGPAFYAADPEGFFVATVETNRPIAAVSVVNHNPAFAFLGLYIVVPEFRGQGIGLTLWHHAIPHAGSRTIGLDGVPAQQERYATSGFVRAGGTTRFVGHVSPEVHPDVRLAADGDIEGLIAWESSESGQHKRAFLTAWFHNTPHRKTLVLGGGEGPQGACTVRRCRSGAKIGPLLARDKRTAELLTRHAASLWPGELMIDVPETAHGLAELCRELDGGMSPGFATARMYRGACTAPGSSYFAVTTLELG